MKFYTNQHKYYCGIDLHTKKCISASSMKKEKSGNIAT
jgi:hypothetical protein